MNINTVTTAELEDYRFCPLYFKLNKQYPTSIKRYIPSSIYLEPIKEGINNYFESIFITNSDPNEKELLSIIMKIFDKTSGLNSNDKFLYSPKIQKMLDNASYLFQRLEPLLDNIILHPIRFNIYMEHGGCSVIGRAYPIVKYNNESVVLYFDHDGPMDLQKQFTDINFGTYLLWLHDNAHGVKKVVNIDIKQPSKKYKVFDINFSVMHIIQQSISSIISGIKSEFFYPVSQEKCHSCVGDCYHYFK